MYIQCVILTCLGSCAAGRDPGRLFAADRADEAAARLEQHRRDAREHVPPHQHEVPRSRPQQPPGASLCLPLFPSVSVSLTPPLSLPLSPTLSLSPSPSLPLSPSLSPCSLSLSRPQQHPGASESFNAQNSDPKLPPGSRTHN